MKKINVFVWSIAVLAAFIFGIGTSHAQSNYKHPQVNAKGEYLDANGTKQGWITRENIIMDAKGKKANI